MLKVKEVFGKTLQGEGRQSGMAAIFIRFAGCNMWNGKPEDRHKSGCPFCDTRFDGGDLMTPGEVAEKVLELQNVHTPYLAVFTGGEPLLQPAEDLIKLSNLLQREGFKTQIETNGTRWDANVRANVNFITVSPKVPFERLKASLPWVDCVKLLHPHPAVPFEPFMKFSRGPDARETDFCIQPIEPPIGGKEAWDLNVQESVRLVKELGYPWRLSLQLHKMLGER